jgi:hypothetical protein
MILVLRSNQINGSQSFKGTTTKPVIIINFSTLHTALWLNTIYNFYAVLYFLLSKIQIIALARAHYYISQTPYIISYTTKKNKSKIIECRDNFLVCRSAAAVRSRDPSAGGGRVRKEKRIRKNSWCKCTREKKYITKRWKDKKKRIRKDFWRKIVFLNPDALGLFDTQSAAMINHSLANLSRRAIQSLAAWSLPCLKTSPKIITR